MENRLKGQDKGNGCPLTPRSPVLNSPEMLWHHLTSAAHSRPPNYIDRWNSLKQRNGPKKRYACYSPRRAPSHQWPDGSHCCKRRFNVLLNLRFNFLLNLREVDHFAWLWTREVQNSHQKRWLLCVPAPFSLSLREMMLYSVGCFQLGCFQILNLMGMLQFPRSPKLVLHTCCNCFTFLSWKQPPLAYLEPAIWTNLCLRETGADFTGPLNSFVSGASLTSSSLSSSSSLYL